METKDILRKYPNCKVRYKGHGVVFERGEERIVDFENDLVVKDENGDTWHWNLEICTPLLRPLSDITESEKMQIDMGIDDQAQWLRAGEQGQFLKSCAEMTDYFRSQNIDIDSLIESGKAEAQ